MCYTVGMTKFLTLQDGIAEFSRHLAKRPLSDNTRKAFVGDVRIFERFLGSSQGEQAKSIELALITAEHIKAFLAHQEQGGIANSPKSIERRLTSIKVMFKWLREAGILAGNPADGIAYKPFVDPLPEYLSDAESAEVIQAARTLAAGDRLEMRPLTAIMLVLETGIKKGECLALRVNDIERRQDGRASIWIRYEKQHLHFKDRQLFVSDECLHTLESHIQRYETKDLLFDCTGRNLEYLFNRKIARAAGLDALTFEMLRWSCAVRDYREELLDGEQMQVKYGLSSIGWIEMEAKLVRLVHHATETINGAETG